METPARVRDPLELALLNRYQRDFPLVARPYARIADELQVDESWLRATLCAREADGTVSRIGAVFAPGAIGASTLAALAVPPARLAEVAARVSAQPEVNHNYAREHAFNLWFVVAADTLRQVHAALAAIARDTGLEPIALPLEREFRIDLGFDLGEGVIERAPGAARTFEAPRALDAQERALVAAMASGLSLDAEPFAVLARAAGVDTAFVLARLRAWQDDGTIRRFGVVLRHRPLGFVANAMCVWDVPDADVDRLGSELARAPAVTLCYRRCRAAAWPYNLYAMLHGRDRAAVAAQRDALAARLALDAFPHAVLFSTTAFKQCGARYAHAAALPTAA